MDQDPRLLVRSEPAQSPTVVPLNEMPGLGVESAGVGTVVPTVEGVERLLNEVAPPEPMPTIRRGGEVVVTLPAGYLDGSGVLHKTAQVRELTGYDEEHLSHVDSMKNSGIFVTELLLHGVMEIGGEAPTREVLRQLLIGDRDALTLGVRQATYGDEVEFTLICTECERESNVVVKLSEDVPIKKMDDPTARLYQASLRSGEPVTLQLLNGAAQEGLSENYLKLTTAEVTTTMIAYSLVQIGERRILVHERNDVARSLSAADRETLIEAISGAQPGPQLGNPIVINCATCGKEHPLTLGLPNLFRM